MSSDQIKEQNKQVQPLKNKKDAPDIMTVSKGDNGSHHNMETNTVGNGSILDMNKTPDINHNIQDKDKEDGTDSEGRDNIDIGF
jgi:hypothetical protein